MKKALSVMIQLAWPKVESVASILGVVLLPMVSALPASESGCWLSNPLCTPHSCSSASKQWLTSFQNSPGGDLQSPNTSWLDPFLHQSCELHREADYSKFHPHTHGLCLNFQICIWFLCDGERGLWRTGQTRMANAGHEKQMHTM